MESIAILAILLAPVYAPPTKTLEYSCSFRECFSIIFEIIFGKTTPNWVVVLANERNGKFLPVGVGAMIYDKLRNGSNTVVTTGTCASQLDDTAYAIRGIDEVPIVSTLLRDSRGYPKFDLALLKLDTFMADQGVRLPQKHEISFTSVGTKGKVIGDDKAHDRFHATAISAEIIDKFWCESIGMMLPSGMLCTERFAVPGAKSHIGSPFWVSDGMHDKLVGLYSSRFGSGREVFIPVSDPEVLDWIKINTR